MEVEKEVSPPEKAKLSSCVEKEVSGPQGQSALIFFSLPVSINKSGCNTKKTNVQRDEPFASDGNPLFCPKAPGH